MRNFGNLFVLFERFDAWMDKMRRGGFAVYGLLFTISVVLFIIGLFVYITFAGFPRLNAGFFSGYAGRIPEEAGILPAFTGTLWVMGLVLLLSFPVGVAAGIYLELYQKPGRWSRLMEVNITNLAGIPSVIYGLLGLQFFVRDMELGESILAAGLTLSLLILPLVIVSTREAVRMVPSTVAEAAYALGATRFQTILYHLLPLAFPGIVSGVLLGLSRAIGEASPLLVLGAVAFVPFSPSSIFDYFTVLPVQIFFWATKPQAAFLVNASAAILVLLVLTLILNLLAMRLRERWHKRIES